jgi:maleylacetoacetate isomerase
MVASSRGKYSFGDEITLADLFLYPQVEGAISKYKIDFTNYPNILAVYGNLKVLEPFEKSNPQYCPDFDPNRF